MRQLLLSDLGSRQVGETQVSPAQVGSIQVGSNEGGALQIGSNEGGIAEVGSIQGGSFQMLSSFNELAFAISLQDVRLCRLVYESHRGLPVSSIGKKGPSGHKLSS